MIRSGVSHWTFTRQQGDDRAGQCSDDHRRGVVHGVSITRFSRGGQIGRSGKDRGHRLASGLKDQKGMPDRTKLNHANFAIPGAGIAAALRKS